MYEKIMFLKFEDKSSNAFYGSLIFGSEDPYVLFLSDKVKCSFNDDGLFNHRTGVFEEIFQVLCMDDESVIFRETNRCGGTDRDPRYWMIYKDSPTDDVLDYLQTTGLFEDDIPNMSVIGVSGRDFNYITSKLAYKKVIEFSGMVIPSFGVISSNLYRELSEDQFDKCSTIVNGIGESFSFLVNHQETL